jgi:hypothetical protein
MDHPPYLPDLVLSDFWLFDIIKNDWPTNQIEKASYQDSEFQTQDGILSN